MRRCASRPSAQYPGRGRAGGGIACAFKNVGFSFGGAESCEATVTLYGGAEIERVELRHAGADVGQGAHTAFRQMAAEAVGVPVERVEMVLSDTAYTGNSGSASASRMTWMAGNAIRGAVQEALAAWKNEDRPARAHYRFVPNPTTPLDPETGKSMPNITYGYVAQVVDLTVDVETGHIYVTGSSAPTTWAGLSTRAGRGQIEGPSCRHTATLTEHRGRRRAILNPRLSTT